MARQASKGTLGRQPSRGQLRRQRSSSKIEKERDTYTSGKANWQDSLRGSSLTNGKSGAWEVSPRRTSRSSSVHGKQNGNGYQSDSGGPNRHNLDNNQQPQRRRSRSKSLTGRSETRSPSPNSRLLASTHSSRAKTNSAYQGSATLPRRSSRARASAERQTYANNNRRPSRDRRQSSEFGRESPDSVSDARRSISPAKGGGGGDDPFANYRSFEQFRESRQSGSKRDSYKSLQTRDSSYEVTSTLPPRTFASPPRNSSPPKLSTYSPKNSTFSNFDSNPYTPRKSSNSSTGSGSNLYSDSGFGSTTGATSNSSSSNYYSSYSSSAQNYSNFDSYSQAGATNRSYTENSRKYQEQKRSSSPVKISLGALKLATIQSWDEGGKRSSGVFS